MSDRDFLARRGVLELAMYIEAFMLSWLEGGAWAPKAPPPPYPPMCMYPIGEEVKPQSFIQDFCLDVDTEG